MKGLGFYESYVEEMNKRGLLVMELKRGER